MDPPPIPRDPQRGVPRDERRHLFRKLPRTERNVAHVVEDQVLRLPAAEGPHRVVGGREERDLASVGVLVSME